MTARATTTIGSRLWSGWWWRSACLIRPRCLRVKKRGPKLINVHRTANPSSWRAIPPPDTSSPGRVAIFGPSFFPMLAIERRYGHRFDGIAVEAAGVDADAVGMRAGNVERFHAAGRTEKVLGDVCVE